MPNVKIFIPPEAHVVLSKEKILLSYATLKEFRELYGITSLEAAIKPPGLMWKTINKNHPAGINPVYIDLEKTKFTIVPEEVKEAMETIHEHETGGGERWEK